MNRRTFLKTVGLTVASGTLAGCATAQHSNAKRKPKFEVMINKIDKI